MTDQQNVIPQPELEMMRQEVFRIGAKMDTMPQVYIPRLEHDVWRNTLEKRIDRHAAQIERIETSMAGIELRLSTKIEESIIKALENTNSIQQSWFTTHQGTFMWVVMLAIGLMQFAFYYLKR